MKCPKCNSEWMPSTATIISTCPVCGEIIIPREVGNTPELALTAIYQLYGEAGMRDGKKVVGSFKDLAPSLKKDAKSLAVFVDCNGHTQLLDAKHKGTAEVKTAAERVVCQMRDEMMAEEYCRKMCEVFCKAVGCEISLMLPKTPQTAAPKNDVQKSGQNRSAQNAGQNPKRPAPPAKPQTPSPAPASGSAPPSSTVVSTPEKKTHKTGWLVFAATALLVIALIIGIGSKSADPPSVGGTQSPAQAVAEQTTPKTQTAQSAQQLPQWTVASPSERPPETAAPVLPPETSAPVLPAVGQTVYFGRYEQDDNTQNGKEPLEWTVLYTDETYAVLLSRYGLERRTYTNNQRDSTWADSDMRAWLNGSFLRESFTREERGRLLQWHNTTARNPRYPELNPGSATSDYVFLLSYDEAETLLPTEEMRKCMPTQHLINQGALVNEGYCWWWLRNPGEAQYFVMGVTTRGVIHYAGNEDYLPGSVRPVIVLRYS